MDVPAIVDDSSTRARQARRARFERLFGDVYEPLQRYVRRRAPADVVDDVVADALLVAWRRLDGVPIDAELAWCYGTARRCLANARRTMGRRDRLTQRAAIDAATEPADGEPEPGGDTELSAALADLSDDDRELVHLWAWEQLEPREIAVVLGTTANAVSIRLHRVKRRLAEQLDERKNERVRGHEEGGRQYGDPTDRPVRGA